MPWAEVPLQPTGSGDCELYATAYITRLFGHSATPEVVRSWAEETRFLKARYPEKVHGVKASWGCWTAAAGLDVAISYSQYPGFAEWVRAYAAHGCVGLAIMHLRADYGHAVVILEADESGVLLADSCRGLVRDPWEFFKCPIPDGFPTRVEAWYRVPVAGT